MVFVLQCAFATLHGLFVGFLVSTPAENTLAECQLRCAKVEQLSLWKDLSEHRYVFEGTSYEAA